MEEKKPEFNIMYDVASLPRGTKIDKIMTIKNDFGILLYDTSRGGAKPRLVDSSLDIEIVDLKNNPEYLELLKDDEDGSNG